MQIMNTTKHEPRRPAIHEWRSSLGRRVQLVLSLRLTEHPKTCATDVAGRDGQSASPRVVKARSRAARVCACCVACALVVAVEFTIHAAAADTTADPRARPAIARNVSAPLVRAGHH